MALQQQQAFVVDLIEQVKRKRARKREGPFEGTSSEAFTSNRGNKLRRNAKYTERGRLDNPFGISTYKQEIDYNGYKRSIISRNPPLYDADGDLVDNEDEVEEGAASPYEENIYKDVRLEETLQPLIAASDLPTHPSLSQPYYDRGLPEMIKKTEEMLHEEQRTLWKLKQLFTQLRGDSAWAPVGDFHDVYDDWLLDDPSMNGDVPETSSVQDYALKSMTNGSDSQGQGSKRPSIHVQEPIAVTNGAIATAQISVDMVTANGNGVQSNISVGEAMNTTESGTSKESLLKGQEQPAEDPPTNGNPRTNGVDVTDQEMQDAPPPNGTAEQRTVAEDEQEQEPPQRMTTRALARSTPPPDTNASRSPSPTSTISTTQPHPMFTFPSHSRPDFNLGLPPPLADECRAILLNYVSKQEEVVRQLRNLHQGLLKGQRMRRNVLKWCKADGHVGELSDGEDWYDLDEWGLVEGELVKGKEEEEDDGGNQGAAGGSGGGGGGGGGSKKTRRAAGKEKN